MQPFLQVAQLQQLRQPEATATPPPAPTATPTKVSTVLAAQVTPRPAGAPIGIVRGPNTGSGPDNGGRAAPLWAITLAATLSLVSGVGVLALARRRR